MSLEAITELPPLPRRPADGHKGTFGHVLVLAGSRGMSGAAVLAGCSALRGGAGLVSVAVPRGIQPIVAASEPSYLTLGLAEDNEGCFDRDVIVSLHQLLESVDVVACGPGWGKSRGLTDLAAAIFTQVELPVVFDADALNALAQRPEVWEHAAGPRLLTPHPGEFARLSGLETREIQANRSEIAARWAREHNVVLLLKGQGTVITDGHRIAINQTGNSGMSTGGTGDVLTGLLAALLAQGMTLFEAGQLGAHLHGLAGDLAAAELSEPGLIASDLPKYLARAWRVCAEKGESRKE